MRMHKYRKISSSPRSHFLY